MEHHKLVRDLIPEVIRDSGHACGVEVMHDDEYRAALRRKLVEEASEAADAHPEQLVAELADLYEVIDSLAEAFGIERDAVLAAQQRRRRDLGSFRKRLRLLWTE